MKKYVLGIDNGSTFIKAGLYNLKGEELATYKDKVEMFSPKPGLYERDLNEIWNVNANVIKELLKKSGINSEEIIGISLTGYGNGIHLVDENGEPTYNSVESADSRGNYIVEQWNSSNKYDEVQPKNMQSLWPALSIVMLAWFAENEPEILNKSKWMFSCKDYIRYKLTGEANAEITDVSGSGIINIEERKVDKTIFEALGISEYYDLVPKLVHSTDICGGITKEVALLTGLKEGTRVVAGCYDIDAAALATGASNDGDATIIVGTWCNNQCISNEPIYNKEFFSTTVFSGENQYLVLEGSPTSAVNLEWFITRFLETEAKIAVDTGVSVFDICNSAVELVGPEDSDIIFLPFLYGTNAATDAKSVLLGMEGWHTRDHIIRAIYEGICFSHRWHLEKLYKSIDKPETAKIAGGATRSKQWMQMFADVLQLPVIMTKGEELGTLGAGIVAATGVGEFENLNEAIKEMVENIDTINNNPELEAIYTKKYLRYKKIIEVLNPVWKDLK